MFTGKIAHFGIVLLIAVALAGCKRDEVKVYRVTNDEPSSPAPNEMAAPEQNSAAQPQLQFILPDGWQEKAPSEMRAASFNVAGTNGEIADVGVIPLPTGGSELDLVNMWREQMQLPALTNETAAETVSVGSQPAKLFDIASEQPLIDGKFRARILVAELTRGDTSWFFKMTGEDSFVAAQKENFLQFLKSVSFMENSPAQMTAAPETQNPNVNSIWAIPPGWKPLPPSQFLLAEFAIAGTNGSKADVNVAELGGTGGGLLANVNRWRRQLGLPPTTETDLPTLVNTIHVAGGEIKIVDMIGANAKTGKPVRLVGAVLPQNGQTWFYKLMGDEQIVALQKGAFIKFMESAKYPNAR